MRSSRLLPSPLAPRFPSTTLFRSSSWSASRPSGPPRRSGTIGSVLILRPIPRVFLDERKRLKGSHRSEEHTSELQSPCNIVCRLLLEKEKITRKDMDDVQAQGDAP